MAKEFEVVVVVVVAQSASGQKVTAAPRALNRFVCLSNCDGVGPSLRLNYSFAVEWALNIKSAANALLLLLFCLFGRFLYPSSSAPAASLRQPAWRYRRAVVVVVVVCLFVWTFSLSLFICSCSLIQEACVEVPRAVIRSPRVGPGEER